LNKIGFNVGEPRLPLVEPDAVTAALIDGSPEEIQDRFTGEVRTKLLRLKFKRLLSKAAPFVTLIFGERKNLDKSPVNFGIFILYLFSVSITYSKLPVKYLRFFPLFHSFLNTGELRRQNASILPSGKTLIAVPDTIRSRSCRLFPAPLMPVILPTICFTVGVATIPARCPGRGKFRSGIVIRVAPADPLFGQHDTPGRHPEKTACPVYKARPDNRRCSSPAPPASHVPHRRR